MNQTIKQSNNHPYTTLTTPDVVAHQHHRVRSEPPSFCLAHARILVPEVLGAIRSVSPDQKRHLWGFDPARCFPATPTPTQ